MGEWVTEFQTDKKNNSVGIPASAPVSEYSL